jgi:hypothetical protein
VFTNTCEKKETNFEVTLKMMRKSHGTCNQRKSFKSFSTFLAKKATYPLKVGMEK